MSTRDELEAELNRYLPGYLEGAESDIPADHLAECLADWLHDEGWRKVDPAAETRTEWGVRRPAEPTQYVLGPIRRSEAKSIARIPSGSVVVSRTVTCGPWTEVEQ